MRSDTTRTAVLERIRRALGDAAQTPGQQESLRIDLTSRTMPATDRTLALFQERLREYEAIVEMVSDRDVPDALARVLIDRGRPRVVVPEGFPQAWLPEGTPFEVDTGLSARELDGFAGVLTTATLGIAETGTVVLQGVPGQGRRAVSLVPDFHLCLLRACDVLRTVPEAIARLDATAALPTTFISGPSATADIEMTRIKGVHGPRFLHVMLVG